jgi:hypothetical protein
MSQHPINLALRFVLELAGLYAMGYWGWNALESPWRWLAAIGIPFIAAGIWGIFRVPDDGGPPVVKVPGIVRLSIEFDYFTAAVLALWFAGQQQAALIFLIVVVGHYAVSYDRVIRLIKLRT